MYGAIQMEIHLIIFRDMDSSRVSSGAERRHGDGSRAANVIEIYLTEVLTRKFRMV